MINDELNKYNADIEKYTEIIKNNPNDADAYQRRGDYKIKHGVYESAIEDFDKAINLNPKFALAYYYRGLAKLHFWDIKGAIEDYNKTLELNPNYASSYEVKGFNKALFEEYKEAIDAYNQTKKIDSKLADAYISRGKIKEMHGNYNGALEDYNQDETLPPHKTPVVLNTKDYNYGIIARDWYLYGILNEDPIGNNLPGLPPPPKDFVLGEYDKKSGKIIELTPEEYQRKPIEFPPNYFFRPIKF